MNKTGDIAMGRPREGSPVSHKVYVKYIKKEKERLKKELRQPKVVGPRNFSDDQVCKDAEAKAAGTFSREVFRPGTCVRTEQGAVSPVSRL